MAIKRRTRDNDSSGTISLEKLVEKLIGKYMEAIKDNTLKVTVADLIRMRELRKELAPAQPVRADVTWIDGWD
jgi:hypothetical protein